MRFKINSKIFSDKLVICLIESIHNHPNADKLKILSVNVGLDKFLQIICGASNYQEKSLVPVALTGANVKDKKGNYYQIEKTEIRDVESERMLCTESELGIGIDSKNILILPSDLEIYLGEPLLYTP